MGKFYIVSQARLSLIHESLACETKFYHFFFCCTARILFPPAASLPHPTTPITAVSQRGDGMSSEDSGSVETFTLPEDQHQGWVPPRPCILFSCIFIFSFSVLFRLSLSAIKV